MAKLDPKQLAQQTALRGQTEEAAAQLTANLAAGDFGAAASLAQLEAFQGRWPEALAHAYIFLRHPLSAYAINVFDDIANLVAVVGIQRGGWPAVHREVAAIHAELAAGDAKTVECGRRIDQLVELARSGGKSSYVWDRGIHSTLDEDARAAQFDAAAAELVADKKKKRFKNDAERRKHLFSLANRYGSYRSAIRLYDEEGIADVILFASLAFTASGLARAGRAEEGWAVLEKGFKLWWPVDFAQVAPLELLTDEGLRGLMTPERCAWILRTPRGPEGAPKKK